MKIKYTLGVVMFCFLFYLKNQSKWAHDFEIWLNQKQYYRITSHTELQPKYNIYIFVRKNCCLQNLNRHTEGVWTDIQTDRRTDGRTDGRTYTRMRSAISSSVARGYVPLPSPQQQSNIISKLRSDKRLLNYRHLNNRKI